VKKVFRCSCTATRRRNAKQEKALQGLWLNTAAGVAVAAVVVVADAGSSSPLMWLLYFVEMNTR
jgi:hypothetical protein